MKKDNFQVELNKCKESLDSWRREASRFKTKWLALDKRHGRLLKALWITAAVIVIESVQALAFIWWIK